MKADRILPTDVLKPYIQCFVVSEQEMESEYKVFPPSGLVIGFQYRGQLAAVQDQTAIKLSSAGITGMSDRYKVFKNSAGTGSILVYFTETGFAHFATHPAHELFDQSIALEHLFAPSKVRQTEEQLSLAQTDQQRIRIVEQFLLSQLKDIQADQLIMEAVRIIYEAKGAVRIKELAERLFISQSPFEKRFRKLVGTTPKKFASIVRFHAVLAGINSAKSLAEICYDNHFFDQAHFIKDFRKYTGDTPEDFKQSL